MKAAMYQRQGALLSLSEQEYLFNTCERSSVQLFPFIFGQLFVGSPYGGKRECLQGTGHGMYTFRPSTVQETYVEFSRIEGENRVTGWFITLVPIHTVIYGTLWEMYGFWEDR